MSTNVFITNALKCDEAIASVNVYELNIVGFDIICIKDEPLNVTAARASIIVADRRPFSDVPRKSIFRTSDSDSFKDCIST